MQEEMSAIEGTALYRRFESGVEVVPLSRAERLFEAYIEAPMHGYTIFEWRGRLYAEVCGLWFDVGSIAEG